MTAGIYQWGRPMKKIIHPKSALEIGSTVYIRLPEPDDYQEFMELHQKSMNFYRGLASPMTTPQQFANYLSRCNQDDFEGMLICRISDASIVGAINLSQIFRGGFQSAYLGYQVGAPFAEKGYMTEAIQLVLRHAFNIMKLHRLEANIQPDNKASLALVKRAGFTKEGYSRRYLKINGRWRDHERWAILAEDWRAKKRQPGRAD
jgi:[ribosomal protein S5]-alanine N-acetyltransferase